jgi:hypothetical protein
LGFDAAKYGVEIAEELGVAGPAGKVQVPHGFFEQRRFIGGRFGGWGAHPMQAGGGVEIVYFLAVNRVAVLP